MQVSNGIVVLKSHVNVTEDMDSSRQDINLDSDYVSISSTTFVTSIVSEESSTDHLPTDFLSEDRSSICHYFVNDSEFSNSFVSQVDTEVRFALALSFSRTPRLTRNGEDVITIHKKK